MKKTLMTCLSLLFVVTALAQTNTATDNNNANNSEYKNYETFKANGDPWKVPAGVSKICIELWGAGGGGSIHGGGGGGGYIKAYFAVSPGTAVSYRIGTGGTGGPFAGGFGKEGTPSTATVGAVTITATGGRASGFHSAAGEWPGAGGSFSATAGFRNYIGAEGQNGSHNQTSYQQRNASTYVAITKYGNGGDAGNTQHTGGIGNYAVVNEANNTVLTRSYALDAGVPGGGGASFYCNICTSKPGANGQMIIYY